MFLLNNSVLLIFYLFFGLINASAQHTSYPSRPIRMINPYAPGGAVDVVSRPFAQKLSESLGQAVIIDNRPGAGTNIGTELVVKSNPDGHTILLTSAVIATNVSLYQLPFDPIRDLSPIIEPLQSPFILTVSNSLNVKSTQELLAISRLKPNEISFGSAGNGTTTHLMLELFKSMGKVNILHVPYKGGAPAINALVGGEVQISMLPFAVVMPQARAARIRALSVTRSKRISQAPEIPTVAESGLPGFDPIGWYAFFAPAKTPKEIVNKLNFEMNQILNIQDIKERFISNGMFPTGGSPDFLHNHLKSEILRWNKVIKSSGIKPE